MALNRNSGKTTVSGYQTHYLLLFGVKIETLIQGAAVLMDVLLPVPHILCILHHLLLNVTKQTDKKTTAPKANHYINLSLSKKKNWRQRIEEENKADQSLILCSHSIISFTCGGPPEPQSFRALNNKS